MDCEKIVIVLYALEQLAIIGFGKSRSARWLWGEFRSLASQWSQLQPSGAPANNKNVLNIVFKFHDTGSY